MALEQTITGTVSNDDLQSMTIQRGLEGSFECSGSFLIGTTGKSIHVELTQSELNAVLPVLASALKRQIVNNYGVEIE